MTLSDLPVRVVIAPEMSEPVTYGPKPTVTEEQKRERSRKKVYAWRERNRERWNEIQRNSRKRRAKG